MYAIFFPDHADCQKRADVAGSDKLLRQIHEAKNSPTRRLLGVLQLRSDEYKGNLLQS